MPDIGGLGMSSKRTISQVGGSGFERSFKEVKKMRKERLEGDIAEVERMRKALNQMKDLGCALCTVSGEEEEEHKIYHCGMLSKMGLKFKDYTDWKKKIRYYSHKGICWKCHVPTCGDELHGVLVKGSMDCEWEDIVMPVALGVYMRRETREAGEKYFGVEWKDMEMFVSWLMKKPGNGRLSWGMDLLLWFVEEHRR